MFKIKLWLKQKYNRTFTDRQATRVAKMPHKESLTWTFVIWFWKLVLLIFFAGIIFFPFYLMVATALLSNAEVYDQSKVHINPTTPIWENFAIVIQEGFSYWKSLGVTAAVTVISVILKLFVTMLLGYGFAFKKWYGKKLIWIVLLGTIMLPEIALLGGQYTMIVNFNWHVGPAVIVALFIPFVASVFSAFMFKNAFERIPMRIKEAALVDGAGGFRYFVKIAVPMISPTTWTVGILTTLAAWNSFLWPSLLLRGQNIQVITTWMFTTGIPQDAQDTRILFNIRMAGAILVIVPTMLMYFAMRSRIMNAISKQGSSIKG